jgi:hypothetical protein
MDMIDGTDICADVGWGYVKFARLSGLPASVAAGGTLCQRLSERGLTTLPSRVACASPNRFA